MPRLVLAGAVLLALLGCTGPDRASDTSSGSQRFLSGTGTGTFIRAGHRQAAPVLRGESIYGKPLDTSTYLGSVLVLNVWGSWCAPCKKEQPALNRVARETEALGARFVGINVRDSGRTAPQRHAERYGVTYPSFHDPDSQLIAKLRAKAIPSTIVLDRAGRMAAQVFGEVKYAELLDLVREVAAERG